MAVINLTDCNTPYRSANDKRYKRGQNIIYRYSQCIIIPCQIPYQL